MTKFTPNRLVFWQNFGALAILRAANVILPILLYPIILFRLGPELFGLVIFAQAVASYFMIGANYATEIYGTRAVSRVVNEPESLQEVASQIWWMKLLLLAATIICFLLLLLFWGFTHSHLFVFIFSLHVVIYEAFFPGWFYQGIEKVATATLINVGAKLVATALLLIWVIDPKDAWKVPLAYAVAALTMAILSTLLFARHIGGIRTPKWRAIVGHLRLGWPFFVTNLSGMLYVNANRVLIGSIGMAEVAYYDLADRVVQLAKAPQQIFGLTMFARLSKMMEPLRFVRRWAPVSFSINSLLFIAIYLGAPWIVPALSPGISPEGELLAEQVLRILSLNVVVVGLNSVVVIQTALVQNQERNVMRFSLEALGLYGISALSLWLMNEFEVTQLTVLAVGVEAFLLVRTFAFLRHA